jgi:hypothetical protein
VKGRRAKNGKREKRRLGKRGVRREKRGRGERGI